MESSVLTFKEYNIAGNPIRAYYDSDNTLIFVLDSTINARKPNVLLVINPVGNRKWDDILANDYGVDLETVRPKKDNKYQKLDIEYNGLDIYDDLINEYNNGGNIQPVLNTLTEFREASVRRSASERLATAESNAEKARETISRTQDNISELQEKLRQLRAKLSQQKKQIGREPTKKSASKILKTDAQIDATNEKLRRAKKRLDNAQRRLIVADEDAEIAREILADAPIGVTDVAMPRPSAVIKQSSGRTNVAISNTDNSARSTVALVDNDKINTENININNQEQKAKSMAEDKTNEEVKPLFDTDPEILDEEIAFKPIEFGVSSPVDSNPMPENPEVYEQVVEDKPLSFNPPEAKSESEPIDVRPVTENTYDNTLSTPVLDTIKSVDVPHSTSDKLEPEVGDGIKPIVPDPESRPVVNGATANNNMKRPVPPAATLAGASAARPVSPITGDATTTTPVQRKPTLVYYIMLVLLIALSIFTLWLYQNNTDKKTPDLTATVTTTDIVMQESVDAELDSPFISEIEPVKQPAPEVQVTVDEPVAESVTTAIVAEPEPMPVIEPSSVTVETITPAAMEEVTGPVADITIETFAAPNPVIASEPDVVIKPAEEILSTKPAYNVSQNEEMFIAAPDYDTETNYNSSDSSQNIPTCPDGTAPDINGCCTGEIYTNMGSMGFNCCPQTGGDCFPPLL